MLQRDLKVFANRGDDELEVDGLARTRDSLLKIGIGLKRGTLAGAESASGVVRALD